MAVDQKVLEKVMGASWPMMPMIFDDLPQGVVIADAGGMVAYYNQAQFDLDGLQPEDTIGRFMSDITYSPYASSIIFHCLLAQKPVLNHWQLYDSPTTKNIQAISHALPLFHDSRLSGCISFSRGYPKISLDDYLNEIKLDNRPADFVNFGRLVGRSPSFVRAIKAAEAASENHLPVLIHGETGVGKELFARGIHNASSRSAKPFVAVNCSAIPENLFESLMFGISRGAFTGAMDKAGFFEEANGGTIYLDEIDSMPLSLQPKVLRVLQEGEVRRLGSGHDLSLDVKVVSSMSQDPLQVVKGGQFRSDLFYRLGAIIINIPPLRERSGDLPLLTDHFISKHSATLGKRIQRASHDFVELLLKSTWPGNVRELEHIITGAITLASPRRQTLGADLMPEYFKNMVFYAQNNFNKSPIKEDTFKEDRAAGNLTNAPQPAENADIPEVGLFEPQHNDGGSTEMHLLYEFLKKSFAQAGPAARASAPSLEAQKAESAQAERQLVCDFLKKSFGNVALAARLMGVSPQVVHYKIKKLKINVKNFKNR